MRPQTSCSPHCGVVQQHAFERSSSSLLEHRHGGARPSHGCGARPHRRRSFANPAGVAAANGATSFEIRICTNKTCKRQGSTQLAQFVKDLALPGVDVLPVGCLGSCGSGPNVAVVPLDGTQPLLLRHISTPAKLSEVLREICGAPVDATLLRATELRLAGNAAARDGRLPRAIELYSEALALRPPAGEHLLLSNRSGARLAAGDAAGALADAEAAAACAPPDFTTAAVRRVEALLTLARPQEALDVLDAACCGQAGFAASDAFRALSRAAAAALERQRVRA